MEDDKLIEAVLASGMKIPPMPAMLIQALALERDDNAGPREFSVLLGRDPALAGAIFRLAASPVLGLRAKVESLEKAITVLGLRTSLAVVRYESLRGVLGDPALAGAMQAIWARMTGVADLVLALTRALRPRGIREDQAYLAAMFHDCGVALLCRRDPSYARAFAGAQAWPDLSRLDEEHATNHTVVGMMVARNWQLPAAAALAVRHHHDPGMAALPEAASVMILLIQLATHLLARRAGYNEPEWQACWLAPVNAFCENSNITLA